MSTILHRRDLHVAISAKESGREFADAAADVQVEFIAGMAEAVAAMSSKGGSWPFQCRFLVDEMDADARREAALMFETLVEHLNEPTPSPDKYEA